MVTMGQVAEQAGVSQATVSYILGGKSSRLRISPQTQERVLKVARELGYHRNLLARAMVTGKSRIIGIITSVDMGEPIIRILSGAIEAANNHEYLVKVIHLSYSGIDSTTIARCMEWRLAGAVVVGLPDASGRWLHDEFQRIQLPLSLIDNAPLPEWGIRYISDDAYGISQAVSHLVELGHCRIAFLGGNESTLSEWRESSFRSAIAEAGLPLPAHWVRNTSWFDQPVIEKGVRALLQADRPTGIVCSGDTLAMIVLRVAKELGLRIPEDLSVTGYSNSELSSFATPPLTTVEQPFHEMGHAAVMHLIDCAESDDLSLSTAQHPETLFATRILVRGSTAPPAPAI